MDRPLLYDLPASARAALPFPGVPCLSQPPGFQGQRRYSNMIVAAQAPEWGSIPWHESNLRAAKSLHAAARRRWLNVAREAVLAKEALEAAKSNLDAAEEQLKLSRADR
jgi:hypothetical protein